MGFQTCSIIYVIRKTPNLVIAFTHLLQYIYLNESTAVTRFGVLRITYIIEHVWNHHYLKVTNLEMEPFLMMLVGDFKFFKTYKHSPDSKLDLEKVFLILFLIRMAML